MSLQSEDFSYTILAILCARLSLDVAVQVEFESEGLKPGNDIIAKRVENQAPFKLWELHSTVQPHRSQNIPREEAVCYCSPKV
jgi:hypothetical protein